MDIESFAANIMKQAVDLDSKERYTEALIFYQEGLQVLDEKTRGENDERNRNYLKMKIEEFSIRVAAIKERVQKLKEEGKYSEQVHIEEGSSGHGYKKLFGRFLDGSVEHVIIEDSYVRTFHQCQNFLFLCELLVKSCDNLRRIQLKTGKDAKSACNQKDWFYNLKTDLEKYGVELIVVYSNNPYFQQIILSSGWIIKISRGLDMYKAPTNKFCLGVHDLDLRQCHDIKITIVHSKNLKRSLELSHTAAAQRVSRTSGNHRLPRRPLLTRPSNQRGRQSQPVARSLDQSISDEDLFDLFTPEEIIDISNQSSNQRGRQSQPVARRRDQSPSVEELFDLFTHEEIIDMSNHSSNQRGRQSQPVARRRDQSPSVEELFDLFTHEEIIDMSNHSSNQRGRQSQPVARRRDQSPSVEELFDLFTHE